MKNVISLLGRIDQLENQKWKLVLAGAEVKPELQEQFNSIDRKLSKLYFWYSKAMGNGALCGEES